MCNINSDDESEFVHFGFYSGRLYQDFADLAESTIKDNLREIQKVLLANSPSDHEEIKSQMTNLEDLYLARIQEPLQKFKEAAKEIFAVPSNILWSSDDKDKPVTCQELEELDKEIADLQQKYLQASCDQAHLRSELKRFEQVEPLYNRVNEVLKFFNSNRLKGNEKTTQELLQGLKTLENFYYEKCNSVEKSKTRATDVFNLFKSE